MKKIILPIVTFLAVTAMLVLFANLRGADKITAFGETKKDNNVIYIGVYEPLTGDYMLGGLSEALGIRYANSVCHEVTLDGVSYEIKLYESDNAKAVTGSTVAADALTTSKVSAVLGSYGDKLTAVGLPQFEKAGIPVVGISCTSRLATTGTTGYFRLCCTDSFQSGAIANLAYGMDLRHAAVLTQTGDEYSKMAGKIYTKAFTKLGGRVSEFSFQLGQENFRSLAEEIENSDTDFVVMFSGVSEASYFIKQSRDAGLSSPVIGPGSWDSALLLMEVTDRAREVYFASEFNSSPTTDPVSAKFASSFSNWLSEDSNRIAANGGGDYTSAFSAMAYDAYMLVVQAMKKADSSDPKDISAALSTISYDGVSGNISFAQNGEAVKDQVFIKTINVSSAQFDVLQISSIGK